MEDLQSPEVVQGDQLVGGKLYSINSVASDKQHSQTQIIIMM